MAQKGSGLAARLLALSPGARGTALAYAAAVALFIVGGVYRPSFLLPGNIATLLVLSSFVGFTAAGQTFVILIGGIDLSVPWVLNAAAIILTTTSVGQDARAWWVVPLVLLSGVTAGVVNGLGIVFFEIPAVVMTLGMNGIMLGLVLGLTGGFTCPTCNASVPPSVQTLFTGQVGNGPPNALILWALVVIAVGLLLSRTALGRRIYALGNNPLASYLAGVNVRLVTITVYALSGFFAALAGVALAAYGGQATLGMGDSYLFASIAAVVIGGASILGGRGSYWGSVAGSVFLVVLTAVLLEYRISDAYRTIASGVVILIALLLYGRQARET